MKSGAKKAKMTLRRRIVQGTRLFTICICLLVGTAILILSEHYIRQSTLRSVEFNLRQMASHVETSFANADSLLSWAASDSTLRRYLTTNNTTGAMTTAAYESFSDRYLSSALQTRIVRFFVTNDENRFLQLGSLTSSAALNSNTLELFGIPGGEGYGVYLAADPLLPTKPVCLVFCRELRPGAARTHIGTVYLGLETSVITDAAQSYVMPDGGILYWRMGEQLWRLDGKQLTAVEEEPEISQYRGALSMARADTRVARAELDGEKYLLVAVPMSGQDAEMIQLFPQTAFLSQLVLYLLMVAAGIGLIWAMSRLLLRWLDTLITRPVEALQQRIARIGQGDFAADSSIEWEGELGDIGRGINRMAGDIEGLMARRLEDQQREQDLEYRMLQNEMNPHFIYNTLNSIRWMATIQNAPGIAEMVTALARLTKSVSKSTEKLVPLQAELALLNDYFTIQQYRYGGDIEIEVAHIEDETLCQRCMIPRFTLQPLAENAIFHGLEPKGGFGSVLLEIRTDKETGDVLVTMTDDGVGMPPETLAHVLDEPREENTKMEKYRHVGLWNVHRRLQYSFGEKYGLVLESEPDVGTAVTIRLPGTKQESDG